MAARLYSLNTMEHHTMTDNLETIETRPTRLERRLIEARDVAALDARQIRGAWSANSARYAFIGFDYRNQRWVKHEWRTTP